MAQQGMEEKEVKKDTQESGEKKPDGQGRIK